MTGGTFSAYNYNIGRKEVRSDLIMGSRYFGAISAEEVLAVMFGDV